MGDLWDLGSQPADQGSSLQSQKFLLAAGMYIAMFSDADQFCAIRIGMSAYVNSAGVCVPSGN